MRRLLSELRRRHVLRVAAIYAVVSWAVIQVADVTFPYLRLPEWTITAVIVLSALGFPVALVLAYAYEITPDGVRKDRSLADAAPPAPPAAEPDSIAVLPFLNLSSDPENEYFSDGITEEILDALTRVRRLRVASRSASFAFKGQEVDIGEAAARLRVGSVLEGSVRRAGDRVRITAQLVDASTGYHRWSRTFDRQLSDIFAVQAEIARQIAGTFDVSLTAGEERAIGSVPTEDLTAYDYYLRGRYYFHRLTRADLEHGATMFRRATEVDPGYALAYAGLADCLAFLYTWFDHEEAQLQEANAASRRALELQPELAEAHVSHGHVLSLERRYPEAEAEFTEAIRLDPTLFEAYYFFGRACLARGDRPRAARLFGEAHRVRPEDYQSVSLQADAGGATYSPDETRRLWEEALRTLDRHVELNPDDVRAVYFRASALVNAGRPGEAREWGERALAMAPGDSGVTYNVACLEAKLGNRDRALELLERTVDLGFIHRDWIENDPDFDGLRDDPRFEAVRARLG